jgi:long-subunit acyl-CoA synthetase (AMP-forming)
LYIGTYQSRGIEISAAGRVRLDRDDHDRVGEVGPVVPGATVTVESDVDPLFRGNLVVLDF